MAKHEDLSSRVAIHVSPCPEQAIMDALKHIVRDFCQQTKSWVHDVPVIQGEVDTLSYAMQIPEQSVAIHIWGIDGRQGRYQVSTDYYLGFPNQLNFNSKAPSKPIKPLISLMPSSQSDEYPDYIAEYFADCLISGAVGYLQMQPFREWSQPNAAGAHMQMYEQGIARAKRQRDDGLNLSKANGRVRPQYI